MTGTYSQNVYINLDLNKNELRNLVIASASYLSSNRPVANGINDRGLLYYDQSLNHIMVWDGSIWKFAQYLDDRDYVSTDTILADNIWTQTSLILTTASTWVQATMSTVVTYSSITTSYVNGTYYFSDDTNALKDIVPSKYGSVYLPIVKDINGVTISSNDYKVEGNRVLFYKGFTNQVNITGYAPTYIVTSAQTPTIQFLKYIGTKGEFSFDGGKLQIINLPSVALNLPPYEARQLPPINISQLTSSNSYLSINGLMEFDWSIVANYGTYSGPLLIINTASIGYNIDNFDTIKLITN